MKKENYDFGYYSKLLNKAFDSLDELKAAEDEVRKAEEEKQAKALAKKADATKVEEAISAYEQGKAECNEAIKAAYEEYKTKVATAEHKLAQLEQVVDTELNSFLMVHPEGFHYTYKSPDGKTTKNYTYYINRYNVFDAYDEFVDAVDKLWKL